MNKKYFVDCACDKSINGNEVILGNKINGRWMKIPIECYKAIEYAVDNNIALNDVTECFLDLSDKKYFEKIVEKIDSIGLTSSEVIEKLYWSEISSISFSPTNKCNLKCDYCCSDSNLEEKDYLNTEQVKKVIDNIVRLNPKRLVLTGGEPMLRKDFFEILEYAKVNFKGKIILATNATLIQDKDIDNITNNIYALEISLDGYDEESCSKVRGNGVFEKVINVVKKVQSRGFDNISLSMVVGKNNEKDIEKFELLNTELGTKSVIRDFMKIGRGLKSSKEYISNELQNIYIEEKSFYDKKDILINKCKAGNNQLSINHKGDVYPCPILEYDELKMFNILDLNGSIIENIKKRNMKVYNKFDDLKPVNMDECRTCEIKLFCTSCPARMYGLKLNRQEFENNCREMKEIFTPFL
ncbi:MAG: radical SAM protein [Clostridioides sp.]|jgi:radical SAM protein with 4Fe4S-binding SPASM domain|nr:radical SAM protein [Clostridioides sp.]